MSDTEALPKLVLCIPGQWEDRADFLQRVIEASDGEYLFAGGVLMHVPTRHVFELEFEARDERMAAAFAAAGAHWRATADMARIDAHRSVAYLLGYGGSVPNVEALMLAARALLDAGGVGVKIENSGLAHAPGTWRTLCAQSALAGPYRAFVVVVTGAGDEEGSAGACSCGMHAFGLRDVLVLDDDVAAAARVAQSFSSYLFIERPDIRAGQTFSADHGAPVYRIASGAGVDYGPDSPYSNPYGIWRLAPR